MHGAERGNAQDVVHFTPRSKDVERKFLAHQFALEFDEVGRDVVGWGEVCFIQCLCVRPSQCHDIASVAPHIPLLAGVGAPSLCVKAKGPVDEDVAPRSLWINVDIEVWPPANQKFDLPKAFRRLPMSPPD